MKKRRPGRPRGKKTTYTEQGLSHDENRMRAIWGDLAGSDGASFVHQLWVSQNPSPGTIERWSRYADPDALKAEHVKGWAHQLGEEAAARFAKGDFKFFADMAEMARRLICDAPWQRDIVRTILLAHVGLDLGKDPSRKFTVPELLDSLPWGRHRPSETQLRRLCRSEGVPLIGGRPAKR